MAVVNERYGEALLELADNDETLKEYLEEAKLLLKIFDETPELPTLFASPKIGLEEKEQFVRNCFEGRLLPDMVGLIVMLLRNGRETQLRGVLEYVISGAKEKLGVPMVYVESAAPLSDGIKKALEAKIIATTRYKSLEMSYATNKSLIGGMRVRLGDRILDNTIDTKIKLLRSELRDNNRKDR